MTLAGSLIILPGHEISRSPYQVISVNSGWYVTRKSGEREPGNIGSTRGEGGEDMPEGGPSIGAKGIVRET